MKGLILKDLLVLRQQSRIYLFMVLMFAGFAFLNKDPSFAGGMAAIVAVMLPITALSYDERSGWDRLALSMPLGRRELVLSKYALGGLCSAAAFLISFVLGLVSPGSEGSPLADAFMSALIFWGICLFLFAILMPLFVRFGVEKGRMIMLAVFFIPTGLLIFISQAGFVPPDRTDLEAVLRWSPALALLAFAGSAFISIRLYSKKEF